MWLYGSAGAGKSAIAQSIAELCAAQGILLDSFFFWRTDSTRNHGNYLFLTFAYQIASMYPEARGLIEAVVEQPRIIIDGLDECQDSTVKCSVLGAIANTLTRQPGRLPLIFLVASRPEQDIAMTFNQISTNQGHLHRVVTQLALDDCYGSSADIELFCEINSTRFDKTIH